jgi:hypothetical protein
MLTDGRFYTGVVAGMILLWVIDRYIFKTPGTPSSNSAG